MVGGKTVRVGWGGGGGRGARRSSCNVVGAGVSREEEEGTDQGGLGKSRVLK